jgi:hypothetical protein
MTELGKLLREKMARNVGALVTQPVVPTGAAVSERIVRMGWQVEHVLSGPTAAVLDRCEEIDRAFPAMGYGTRISWSCTALGRTDAVVTRARSCD